MEIKEFKARSNHIRAAYHQLEVKQDGHPWNTEQDALAFLTDAALVGRLVMDKQGSWPSEDNMFSLDYKIAESMWWLNSIATANNIDIETALKSFLEAREKYTSVNNRD
ncbi:30S ribosomal protein S15 [Paucilactobacillus hokkaidonensis JCM 18461]|uniref:30S ribosomal protein S15 n=2 Tax=Paucilactobacillus hokkaidonensis TaxID=1193095 RepID=A0A0A1GST4_9LACO|nr:MazG-like protein [Paucilactobacillus hokkaidonensis]KRO11413.1 hypothetical protein IV59_GL000153 [Paucilactobacillus hokkaidonensis]BAP85035.1 30S ribosomal protein S15 [Paucilactobacillus hokkaidonensis JCM 18461]